MKSPSSGRGNEVSPSSQPTMASETGGSEQQYSLRWNDFHSAILSSFRHLRDEEDFVDVTLACDGCSFSAHKVVLSACSPYFRKLLKANPCQHPIVILRDIQNKDMESLLRFMYNGEVHIGQEQLGDFLKAAQMLQVRGLADVQTPGSVPLVNNVDHNKSSSPSTLLTWPDMPPTGVERDRSRTRKNTDNSAPPKRARSSDLYNAQMRTRTEHLITQDRMKSPERTSNNGLDLRDSLLGQALESSQNMHSNNMSTGDDSSSDGEMSDSEMTVPPRNSIPKQEPLDYGEDSNATNTNGVTLEPPRTPNFPGALLGLQGLLPGPSGMHGTPDNFVSRRSLDLLRVRATDPRPCPKCGKIYRSAHTLRTHLEDKHTICPGYRCVLCGTVAKSRNSLHSHMSRQHRGISTKDLPVLPMPSPFDPELASRLLAKAGVKISPAELRARASPTGPRRSDVKLDAKSGQSAPSETSSICGDNDPEDLTITPSLPHKYADVLPMSPPPSINNLSNTTITKVPAVKAATAKSIESIAQNLSGKPEEYPAALGGSAILDTYLQFMAENSFGVGVTHDQIAAMHAAKLAQLNAIGTHLDRKGYHGGNFDKMPHPPQTASLPPPVSLAHQHFLEQMHRQYTDTINKADITRLDDGVLNLGKERDHIMRDKHSNDRLIRRNSDGRDEPNERDYRKMINDDDNSYDNPIENDTNRSKERRDSSGREDDDYSDEDMQKDGD